MVKMMACCGKCTHYVAHRCANPESKEYGKVRLSNVCWNCPHFDGELYPWDTEEASPVGERPSTFGRVDPRDPTKFISEHEYERLTKKPVK